MAKIEHEILDQRLQCHASNAAEAKHQMRITSKSMYSYTPHELQLTL
jgi:hypothetical protein